MTKEEQEKFLLSLGDLDYIQKKATRLMEKVALVGREDLYKDVEELICLIIGAKINLHLGYNQDPNKQAVVDELFAEGEAMTARINSKTK